MNLNEGCSQDGEGKRVQVSQLSEGFFARDTETVARELIGKLLLCGALVGRIVETEAYLGGDDLASHAAPGPTPRNRLMFGPPGRAYVYFIYGMYHCLNAVAHNGVQAGAVLLRAVEPLSGIEVMQTRRPAAKRLRDLAAGPGRLTQAFAVGSKHNGCCLIDGELRITEDLTATHPHLLVSPRIGIRRSADRLLRFFEKENSCVSGSPLNRLGRPVVCDRA